MCVHSITHMRKFSALDHMQHATSHKEGEEEGEEEGYPIGLVTEHRTEVACSSKK